MGKWALGVALVVACGAWQAPAWAQERVTLLTAARIHTMDVARPHARAMVFDAAGRILAVTNPRRWPRAIRAPPGSTWAMPAWCPG